MTRDKILNKLNAAMRLGLDPRLPPGTKFIVTLENTHQSFTETAQIISTSDLRIPYPYLCRVNRRFSNYGKNRSSVQFDKIMDTHDIHKITSLPKEYDPETDPGWRGRP